MTSRIAVGGEAPYDVLVGRDVAHLVPPLVSASRQVAVITTASVAGYAERVADSLSAAGVRAHRIDVPDAEAAKDISVATACWSRLGELAFTRTDAVVGVGGGAVTDLAGFVAATWLRGVPAVHVPTSLLGMVDAAVGGKTGINTAAGKNLVGAFHPPAGVVCDLAVLAGLPAEDYAAGLAEVIKAGFIADAAILDIIEKDVAAATEPGGAAAAELVERAVRVKATVVGGDLRERDGWAAGKGFGYGREVLNYGHTLAHAIERREGYRWRHGHAVSVGLVFAAEVARLAGRLDADTAARHRALLQSVGLPTRYDRDAWPDLLAAMRVDKKARGTVLRFVVLDGPARPTVVPAPSAELLEEAYAAVAR